MLGDLYKYKRFKLCLNGFSGWTPAQNVAGYDQRATIRLKGLNWCAGNSCGVYNNVQTSSNDLQMTYCDTEAIVPSFIILPINGNNFISYSDSNGICFHRPEPGPKDLNVSFQDVRSNDYFPTYVNTGFYITFPLQLSH